MAMSFFKKGTQIFMIFTIDDDFKFEFEIIIRLNLKFKKS